MDASDWDTFARKQKRKPLMAAAVLGVIGAFLLVGGIAMFAKLTGDERWMAGTITLMGAFLLALAGGGLLPRLGWIPRRVQPTFDDDGERLAVVSQPPGRAAWGTGLAAALWTAMTIVALLAPAGAVPIPLVLLAVLGAVLFVVICLVSIRWQIAAGSAEQRIDYRLFAYADRIERIDRMGFQADKNWLWLDGPATRTWSWFGRPGHPTVRQRTVIVLADLPGIAPAELAAAIERHAGVPIQ